MSEYSPERDSLPLVPGDPSDAVVKSLKNDYEDAIYDRLERHYVGVGPNVLVSAAFHNLDKRVKQVRSNDHETMEGEELEAWLVFGDNRTDYLDFSPVHSALTRIALGEGGSAQFLHKKDGLTAKVYDPNEDDRDHLKIVTSKLPVGGIITATGRDIVIERQAGVVQLDAPGLTETQVKALKIKSIHDKIKNWDDFPDGIFDPFDAIVTGLLKMRQYKGSNHPVIPVVQSSYRATKKK